MKPTRSTKTTLTIRRSSRRAVSSPSGAPHARQKRAISGFSWPQAMQTGMSLILAAFRLHSNGFVGSGVVGLRRGPDRGPFDFSCVRCCYEQPVFVPQSRHV